MPRVGEVRKQVVDRGGVGRRLREEAKHGEHGSAAERRRGGHD